MAHTSKRALHAAKRGLTSWQQEWANKIAEATPLENEPLRKFVVAFGSRANPRLVMEVMASSVAEAQEKHEDLAQLNERVAAYPAPAEAELAEADLQLAANKAQRRAAENDRRAAALDLQHLDAMRRVGAL